MTTIEGKFNLKALTNPQTKADYIMLLDEAILAANELNEQIGRIGVILESNAVAHA